MKKTKQTGFLLFLFVGMHTCIVAQKTYIVSNIPNAPADYKTLKTAIDSVPSGSILLLQPSGVAYDAVTIKKKMVIYGNGYFLGQNFAPNTQANVITSKMPYLKFGAGSDGSIISGIDFAAPGVVDYHIGFDSTSNITVSRCYMQGFGGVGQGSRPRHFNIGASASNITIQQSYISLNSALGDGDAMIYYSNFTTASGILFRNNLVIGNGAFSTFVSNYNNTVMDHNTIVGNFNGLTVYGWIFTNNIFIKVKTSAGDTTLSLNNNEAMDASSKNNISNYSIFPTASANKIIAKTVTPDSLFITSNNSQSITSTDGYYQLRSNSIAKGYSTDLTDCGAFGSGANAYVLSGIPAIPNIYFLQITQSATQSGGLKISIKAKANN